MTNEKKITPAIAGQILDAYKARGVDFHSLSSDAVEWILEWARYYRYRAPTNANGSKARYYHAYLSRLAK
jgi:hypothetical protein